LGSPVKWLTGRYREVVVALLLVGGVALFGSFVHDIYPVGEWLFWHYACYWLCSLVAACACFGMGARTLEVAA